MSNILEIHGLSVEILQKLSYKSKLQKSLKKDLRYFDKEQLLLELYEVSKWYNRQELLSNIPIDYRIKSKESIYSKYQRYYPDSQTRKVFNDILGFRAFCDNYQEVLSLENELFRIADMSSGKSNDDGYRGVHVYFQTDNNHYPIEIQFNTLYDRQINNWLHDYLYKKQEYPNSIGQTMREKYESGLIRNQKEFEEVLNNVLSNS